MSTRQRKPKTSVVEAPRRPDVAARAEELQRENPTWSWGTCLASAKLERAK